MVCLSFFLVPLCLFVFLLFLLSFLLCYLVSFPLFLFYSFINSNVVGVTCVTFLSLLNTTLLPHSLWIINILVKQSICARCAPNQSISKIRSKLCRFKGIKSTLNSYPPIYSLNPPYTLSISTFSYRGVKSITLIFILLGNICKWFTIRCDTKKWLGVGSNHSFETRTGPAGRPGTRPTRAWDRSGSK